MYLAGAPGGGLHIGKGGMLVGNFEFNPYLKGDRSGRGPSFF